MISIEGAMDTIFPLMGFLLGMIIYAMFVFKFYRFIARRNIFHLNLAKYNTSTHPGFKKFFSVLLYCLEYLILFPIFVFFWFGILTLLLTMLSKSSAIESIMLVSISVVGSIRVCAYFSENLSQDLAKMLPFALLGVFLVDFTFFNFGESLEVLKGAVGILDVVFYYWAFTVLIEFLLRIVHALKNNKDEATLEEVGLLNQN